MLNPKERSTGVCFRLTIAPEETLGCSGGHCSFSTAEYRKDLCLAFYNPGCSCALRPCFGFLGKTRTPGPLGPQRGISPLKGGNRGGNRGRDHGGFSGGASFSEMVLREVLG